MGDTWIAIGVVLLAVMAGLLIPVLAQLLLTLRSARRALERLTPRLDRTLAEVQRTTERVGELGTTLNRGSEQVVAMIEETDELRVAVRKLRRALRVATVVANAVGPALAAAVQVFRQSHAERDTAREGDAEQPPPDAAEEAVAVDEG